MADYLARMRSVYGKARPAGPKEKPAETTQASSSKAAPKAAAYYEVDGGEWYWWDGAWGDKWSRKRKRRRRTSTQKLNGKSGTRSIRRRTLSLPKRREGDSATGSTTKDSSGTRFKFGVLKIQPDGQSTCQRWSCVRWSTSSQEMTPPG